VFNAPDRESAEQFARTFADSGDRLMFVEFLHELPVNMAAGKIVQELS
jgi:hypothetical protein